LNDAACALRDSFPEEYRNKFKVFDFGFYVFSKDLKGGNPPIFQQAIDKAKEESEFYILFGKESSSDGIYTTFWFDMKLPSNGHFKCTSSGIKKDLIVKYEVLANRLHDANKKDFSRYYEVEINTMNEIASYIGGLKTCCPLTESTANACEVCVLSVEEVTAKLISQGFVQTKGTKYAISTNTTTTNVGRKLEIEYEDNTTGTTKTIVNIDTEFDKYITLFKERNPDATIKDFRFNELDLCNSIIDSINNAKSFDADLILVAGTFGNVLIGTGSSLIYIKEKAGTFIAPNGGGNCYVFDDFGKLLDQFRSTLYHGIYIFESEKVLYSGSLLSDKNSQF
jgi:hypothetical protein